MAAAIHSIISPLWIGSALQQTADPSLETLDFARILCWDVYHQHLHQALKRWQTWFEDINKRNTLCIAFFDIIQAILLVIFEIGILGTLAICMYTPSSHMGSSTKPVRPSPVTTGLVYLQPSPWLWQGLQYHSKCSYMSWPNQTPCIFLHMSQPVVKSQQSTVYCKWLQEWDNLQYSGMDKTLLWTWIEQIWESGLWKNHTTCATGPLKTLCWS